MDSNKMMNQEFSKDTPEREYSNQTHEAKAKKAEYDRLYLGRNTDRINRKTVIGNTIPNELLQKVQEEMSGIPSFRFAVRAIEGRLKDVS